MEPLVAHSPVEAEFYLKVTPCPRCAKGPWEIQVREPQQDAHDLLARCLHCGLRHEFKFFCPAEDAPASFENPLDTPVDLVNSSSEPSRIIDVAQWLSLFYYLVDAAGNAADKQQTRKFTFQAAQCLDEALKFYGPGDLPPDSAFFSPTSSQSMSRFPERFSRQRLQQLRSKLPDLHVMTRRLVEDAQGVKLAKKVKWKFWRR